LIDFLPEVNVIKMHLVSLVAILYQLEFGTSYNFGFEDGLDLVDSLVLNGQDVAEDHELGPLLLDSDRRQYGVPNVPNYGLPDVPTILPWNQNVFATVKIVPGKNKNLGGTLRLVSQSGPFAPRIVSIKGVVKGFESSDNGRAYALHVHEKGKLGNGCRDAGGHFNPFEREHGRPWDRERHVGDLGNIVAAPSKTSAKVKKRDRLITLGDRSARDIVGRAIVIHEGPDSWGQPTGDAGARLGCGIIKLTRAKKQIKKFKWSSESSEMESLESGSSQVKGSISKVRMSRYKQDP